MLVLTRKSKEAIKIGEDITITIVEIGKGQVRVGIEAPQGVRIYRGEVLERIQDENRLSSTLSVDEFSSIKDRFMKKKDGNENNL